MSSKKGRQQKITETLKNVAVNLAKTHGLTDKEIASSLGICETTLHNTKKYDPEFFKVLKEAKREFDNKLIENALLKRANGMVIKETKTQINPDGQKVITIYEKELPPDPQALALFLRNRMPEEYNKEKTIHAFDLKQEGLSREEAIRLLREDPFFNE